MKIIVIRNIRNGSIHFLPMHETVNEHHVLRQINEAFDWTQTDDYEIIKEIRT